MDHDLYLRPQLDLSSTNAQVCAPRHNSGLLGGRLGLYYERERSEHVPDVQGFPA